MSQTIHSVVGTIRIEPALELTAHNDDSSLGLLLGSLAHQRILSDWNERPARPVCVVSSRRIGSLSAMGGGAIRANLAQLLDDLQAEYDQIQAAK